MLKIENLSTSYKTIDGDVRVLNNINFEIHDNEIFGIAGSQAAVKPLSSKSYTTSLISPCRWTPGEWC